jgi:HK97 family phage major capsid protein
MPLSTADNQIRTRLKELREQLADLRQRRAGAKRERDAAKESFAGASFEPGAKLTDTPEFHAAELAVKKVGDLDDEINELQATETSLLHLIGEADASNGNGNGNHASLELPRTGWDGHRLLRQSDSYAMAREGGLFHSTGHFGTLELGEMADRNEAVQFLRSGSLAAALPAAPPGDVGMPAGLIVPPEFRGIIQPPLLNLSLLDLIPTGTTDSNVVHYVQVTAIPGSAAETADLALKPDEGLTLVDAQAPVTTIAGYIKVSRMALDDMAGLGTMINSLLPYDVRRRLLNQILAGDGTGVNILGLYNQTGIGAPAFVTGDNIADAILRAVTVIVLSDNDPNFVALNPTDWQTLLLMKNTLGSYIYGTPGQLPGGMVAQTIWGLNLSANRLVPAGSPLVGDAMGASILVREGVNVKTSDSDQDDFVRNRVTVLAETRVAFPVWRPTAFAIAATS